MYVHIDTAPDRYVSLFLSSRPPRRFRPDARFYLSAVITPVTGIENWVPPSHRIAESELSPVLLERNSKQDRISFAVHVCLSRRPSLLESTQKIITDIEKRKALKLSEIVATNKASHIMNKL